MGVIARLAARKILSLRGSGRSFQRWGDAKGKPFSVFWFEDLQLLLCCSVETEETRLGMGE